MYLTILYSFLL